MLLGLALDFPGQGAWATCDLQTQERSYSLVHQAFWSHSPVFGAIFKIQEEGFNLIPEVILGKRKHE